MRFTTKIILFASLVAAGPVIHAPAAKSPPALTARELCQAGVPCIIQSEVSVALVYINTAISSLGAETDAVLANVKSCGTMLKRVGAELETDIAAVAADQKTVLESNVVAAISALFNSIRAGVSAIGSNAAVMTADLEDGLTAVTDAIVAIEAVVGPCT